MDAVKRFRTFALLLAVALLCAGAASAGTLTTNLVDSTVTVAASGYATTQFSLTADSATNFTVTNTGTWFTVSPMSGTTPATISVSRSSSTGCNLATGLCPDATFTIAGPTNTLTITVHEGTGGSTGIISASPNPVTVTAANGFSNSNTVVVSTTSSTAFTVSASWSPANSWLSVLPASAIVSSGAPATFYVSGNSSALNPNATYTGTVTLTPSTGDAAVTVNVNFVVGTGGSSSGSTFSLSPNLVSLAYPSGTSSATIGVTSSSATSFTASSDSTWLLVNGGYSTGTQSNGTNLGLTLNTFAASGLSTGLYTGHITVVNTANTADYATVTVNLSVNGASGGGGSTNISVAPATLNFNYQIGRGNPLCQTVWVASTDTYSIGATGRFSANMAGVTGPGSFQVCPIAFGAAAGTYSGSIGLTSATTGVSQSISANLLVSDSASPVVTAAVNSTQGDIVCNASAGCTATVSVTASDGTAIPIAVAASNTWITLSSSPDTTPATFTVQLNPSGLSGLNTGNITINPTGAANGTLVIPVVFALAGGTNTGSGLTLSSSSFAFTQAGTNNLTVSANTTTAFNATVSGANCGWLSISPSGALQTNNTITLTVVQSGVTTGQTYTCNINLATSTGTATVPVTYTPGGSGGSGTFSASPTTLSFTMQQGTAPATQTIHLSGASGTAFAVTSVLANWVTVTPASGTLGANGADLTVGVSPSAVGIGTSSGYLVISPTGASAIQINVSVTVSAASAVTATATPLTFTYQAGGQTPASQTIQVTGAANNLPFSATVTSGSDWLSVTPASGTAGTTAQNVTVSVNPASLQVNKTYTGTIVVAGTGTATGSTTISVTLNVSAPLPTITRITNAASFNTGSIAAGEIITLFGTSMGPATLTVASPTNNVFPTELAGVQVTVNGYLAPIIYVRGDQISVQTPYEINRPFTVNVPVIVRYLGQSSNGVNLTQAGSAPGIFTTGGGTGQGAILNQNLSVNSGSNPAGKGEVVVLYVTGEGQTSPAGVSGKITAAPYPTPVSGQVTVTIGGQPAQVLYAGEAPGLISGVMQVNAIVPTTLTGTGDMPVVVSVGGVGSQTDSRGVGAVTVAVR